ncbi:hypothetical protein D3C71_1489950 [compost metagenome]
MKGIGCTRAPSPTITTAVLACPPSGTSTLARKLGLSIDRRPLSGTSEISMFSTMGFLPPSMTCRRTGSSLSSRPPMQMMTIAACANT